MVAADLGRIAVPAFAAAAFAAAAFPAVVSNE